MRVLLSFLIGLIGVLIEVQAQVRVDRPVTLMGSRFDFAVIADNKEKANQIIDSAVKEMIRIENLISDWKSSSQVSEINRQAGIKAVKVDQELFDLTKRAIYFSEISGGAFDISYASLDKMWHFDGSMKELPSETEIKKSVAKINYRNIILDSASCRIFLKEKGMKISFGSIGKGYASDRGRYVLESLGALGGMVNAAGDLCTWGNNLKHPAWNIAITNPFDVEDNVCIIPMKNQSVATSGSYEKYVEIDGKRYSHIINPQTGYPVRGLASVSIFGPSVETANGFSTAIMVLGAERGLKMLEAFPDYSALLITDEGKVIKSRKFPWKVKTKIKPL